MYAHINTHTQRHCVRKQFYETRHTPVKGWYAPGLKEVGVDHCYKKYGNKEQYPEIKQLIYKS